MSRPLGLLGIGCVLYLAAMPSGAQPAPNAVAVAATLERIVASAEADGTVRSVLEPAVEVTADDRLIYTVRLTNTTDQQLANIRVTSAIPADVRYVEGTASGPGVNVLFSVDGGRTFGAARELSVVVGGSAARPAEPADFTHVRFIFETPLDAGATAFARFAAAGR